MGCNSGNDGNVGADEGKLVMDVGWLGGSSRGALSDAGCASRGGQMAWLGGKYVVTNGIDPGWGCSVWFGVDSLCYWRVRMLVSAYAFDCRCLCLMRCLWSFVVSCLGSVGSNVVYAAYFLCSVIYLCEKFLIRLIRIIICMYAVFYIRFCVCVDLFAFLCS